MYIISVIYIISIIQIMFLTLVVSYFSGVISDDDNETSNQDNPVDREDMPDGSRTPPTPPSQSPPPTSPLLSRVRAVAHLRPVSIPDIVRDMAGKDPKRKLADFDRRYMPDGVPLPEASGTGKTGENRSNLKRKAKGIARSLAEVFAYLTFNTSSLNESKKLLSIITNVSLRIKCIISIMCIKYIIRFKCIMFIAFVIVHSLIFSQRI